MEQVTSIKSWSKDDRPREKLMEKGAAVLSDAELMAILIGSGTKSESAVDLSRRILKSVSNELNVLGSLGLRELTQFKGIGPAKAITIMAAMELGKRRRAQEVKESTKIVGSHIAYERFLVHMSGLKHEEFWVMCLNNSAKVIAMKKISEGGFSSTMVDPKRVFKIALENNATGIIIAHNHPSGTLTPSRQDEQITKRLFEASTLLGCRFEDHIIVTDNGYYSFADEGMLTAT